MLPVLYFIMKVSGMIRLNTAEYKFILIVVFLNFNLQGGPKVTTHTQPFNNSRNLYQNCSKTLENIEISQTQIF